MFKGVYNKMNKAQIITGETLKTFGQGALGAMTFGAYHQYTTNKIMDLNNEKVEIQHRYFMEKMESSHKNEMDKMVISHKNEMDKMESSHKLLNDKLDKLERVVSQREKQSGWWW